MHQHELSRVEHVGHLHVSDGKSRESMCSLNSKKFSFALSCKTRKGTTRSFPEAQRTVGSYTEPRATNTSTYNPARGIPQASP
jgi:hypothetical protein